MSQLQSNNQPPNTPSFKIPGYVLDDLCSRFIINVPEEERQDLIRIFFQIELAHWFYLDFYCAENHELKTCGIKDFSSQIFHHCPSLSEHVAEVDKILGNWKSYKMSVPTYGAIMLDPTSKYCLLVQGFWAKASWGFPKGKVNESETPWECAIREVFEETGFDVAQLIDRNVYLENKMADQLTRLYIIKDVPLDTKFQPKTRKEIKSLQWFPLDSLPAHKRDLVSKTQLGLNPNTFFMVIPFVKALRKWVGSRQNPGSTSGASGPLSGKLPPSGRPLSAGVGNDQWSSKEQDNVANTNRQFRDKQKQRQQQYFSQLNQNEYQEFMQFKDAKSRARDSRERKKKENSEGDRWSQSQGYSSPGGYKSDRKQQQQAQQYHILNRDGSVGKPRRSLATQFDNQGSGQSRQSQQHHQSQQQHQTHQQQQQQGPKYGGKGERRHRRNENTQPCDIENFVPQAWVNFKLDVESVLACIG